MEAWLAKFEEGDTRTAWDLFTGQYRGLILATIRRLVPDRDDLMDVFSGLQSALAADDFARLRRYAQGAEPRPAVGPWLVAVTRNFTIDWLRARDGRRRVSIPGGLSAFQQLVFTTICIEGHSPAEAFELLRSRAPAPQSFREFLREVRAVHRVAPCPGETLARRKWNAPDSEALAAETADPAASAEAAEWVAAALSRQPPDVRLAVQLFVVDGIGAGEVARAVGWPNAKTVYNRVYRTLAALRAGLEARGIGPGDL